MFITVLSIILGITPIAILIFGLFWAFEDKRKDKEEYEEHKDELNKY
jgi:glucose uptake protein GlcU